MAHAKCEFSQNDHTIFIQSSEMPLLQLRVPLALGGDTLTTQDDIHP